MHYRWWILLLLFLGSANNYLDRQNLSVAQPVLKDELDMSASEYSWVLTAFMIAYALFHPITGRLIDRFGTKIGFAACTLWWSIAIMLHATVNGVYSLAAYRFMLGVGEAGLLPATVKTVAEWFPKSERALAIGIVNVGIGVGAMIAPPFMAYLILAFNWRVAFIISGLLGIVWLVVWQGVYRDKSPPARAVPASGNSTGPNPENGRQVEEDPAGAADETEPFSWIRLLRIPQVGGLMCARFLADSVWYFYLFWVPPYLNEVRGFDIKQIGAYAWIPFFAAVVGNVLGGCLPAILIRSGHSLTFVRKLMFAASAYLIPVTICTAFVQSSWAAIAFIALAIFLSWIWATTLFTLPVDLFPSRIVGSVYGLTGAAGSVGAVLFMPLVGYLVDFFSYTPIFIIVGLLHPLAASILLLTIRRVERIDLG